MGQKASDISVANGCAACHDAMDGRSMVLSQEAWLFYALRGLQETLQQRFESGLLVIPIDVETPLMDRPIHPRKPKEQRTKIQSRPFPKGRKWKKQNQS